MQAFFGLAHPGQVANLLFLASVKLTDRTLAGDAIHFPTQLAHVVKMIFTPFNYSLIQRDQDDPLANPLSTKDKTSAVTNAIAEMTKVGAVMRQLGENSWGQINKDNTDVP